MTQTRSEAESTQKVSALEQAIKIIAQMEAEKSKQNSQGSPETQKLKIDKSALLAFQASLSKKYESFTKELDKGIEEAKNEKAKILALTEIHNPLYSNSAYQSAFNDQADFLGYSDTSTEFDDILKKSDNSLLANLDRDIAQLQQLKEKITNAQNNLINKYQEEKYRLFLQQETIKQREKELDDKIIEIKKSVIDEDQNAGSQCFEKTVINNPKQVKTFLEVFGPFLHTDQEAKSLNRNFGYGRVIGSQDLLSGKEKDQVNTIKKEITSKWEQLRVSKVSMSDEEFLQEAKKVEREVMQLQERRNEIQGNKVLSATTISNIKEYSINLPLKKIQQIHNGMLQESRSYSHIYGYYDSLSTTLLKNAGEALAKKYGEYIQFDLKSGNLEIYSEEQIKKVIDSELRSAEAQSEQAMGKLCAQTDVEIDGIRAQFATRQEWLEKTKMRSSQIDTVAAFTKQLLEAASREVKEDVLSAIHQCDQEIKKTKTSFKPVRENTHELLRQVLELPNTLLQRTNQGTLTHDVLESFVSDLKIKSASGKSELNIAKLNYQQADELYAAVLTKLKSAKEKLGVAIEDVSAECKKALDNMNNEKSKLEAKKVKRFEQWEVVDQAQKSIQAYAKSAIAYSAVNKSVSNVLQQCKKPDLHHNLKEVLAAREKLISLVKLHSTQLNVEEAKKAKEKAEQDYNVAETIFLKIKDGLEDDLKSAKESKLVAEELFSKIKQQFGDESAKPYQAMVDHANQAFAEAEQAKNDIETQLNQAKQALRDMQVCIDYPSECRALAELQNKIVLYQLEAEKICNENLKTTPLEIMNEELDKPDEIKKRVGDFINKFQKVEEFLKKQADAKEKFLQSHAVLKELFGDASADQSDHKNAAHEKLSDLHLSYSKLASEMKDPLPEVLDKKIPEKILSAYADKVGPIIEERKDERDGKLKAKLLRNFIKGFASQFSVFFRGEELCDRKGTKVPKRLAKAYHSLCDVKTDTKTKLEIFDKKIRDRLNRPSFFKTNGNADIFCKELSRGIDLKTCSPEELQNRITEIQKAFALSNAPKGDTKTNVRRNKF